MDDELENLFYEALRNALDGCDVTDLRLRHAASSMIDVVEEYAFGGLPPS